MEEVRNCGPFVTVRVNVPELELPLQYIWINVAKGGKDWVLVDLADDRGRAYGGPFTICA